jgi:hypothetical protein
MLFFFFILEKKINFNYISIILFLQDFGMNIELSNSDASFEYNKFYLWSCTAKYNQCKSEWILSINVHEFTTFQ